MNFPANYDFDLNTYFILFVYAVKGIEGGYQKSRQEKS